MGLKIAIGGKGGVGKTTVSALLARSFAANQDNNVIAIDADPVSNLAAGLGIDESVPITPIAELRDLIAERTGAEPGTMGGFFTLNPKVDDIPERFSRERDNVKLLVMGTVCRTGAAGFLIIYAALASLGAGEYLGAGVQMVLSLCGIVTAASLFFAFLPPKAYARFIERRAATSGAS